MCCACRAAHAFQRCCVPWNDGARFGPGVFPEARHTVQLRIPDYAVHCALYLSQVEVVVAPKVSQSSTCPGRLADCGLEVPHGTRYPAHPSATCCLEERILQSPCLTAVGVFESLGVAVPATDAD